MTKSEIMDAIYERLGGFSKREAAELVDAVFNTMKTELAQGNKVKISGFGNFVVRDKTQRMGRNPQTGDPLAISARRVLTFKCSQVLRSVLNPNRPSSSPAAASSATSTKSSRASTKPSVMLEWSASSRIASITSKPNNHAARKATTHTTSPTHAHRSETQTQTPISGFLQRHHGKLSSLKPEDQEAS